MTKIKVEEINNINLDNGKWWQPKIDKKLSNENFLKRAPKSVIEKERSNQNKLNQELEKISKNLEMIR